MDISLTGPLNGIRVIVENLNAAFYSSNFKYVLLFLDCEGTVLVNMRNVRIEVVYSMTRQTLSDGRVIPAITNMVSSVQLPTDDIEIVIQGNIWA
jgi:hypothetical protein